MIDLDFWRGKRVFMTGHTGFKGSWLSLWLQELGADLTGFSLGAPTNPSLFETTGVGLGMRSIIGDIRDARAVSDAMALSAPEIVIHMAAQPLVRYSYDHPVETYSTNVMGLVNLFEAVRQTPSIRALVNVTTDKCYENREWHWGYREQEAMGGHDPYSSSKGCAELVTSAYRRSYFSEGGRGQWPVALGSARAGNVIGGGDWALDRLIPDIMRSIAGNRTVFIRNPHAIRPWQHVLEPLSGYLLLAERLYTDGAPFADGWNFGPSDEDAKPVQWVVEHLAAAWGKDASWQLDTVQGPHEATFLKLDCSKARAALDWAPAWRLGEALDRIVEWYRAYVQGEDMRATTISQINHYQQALREI
ncbi:CDP-glucose 4,6-dehydratase [Rhizobium sp. SAFR-030]|uniref:CDP-glucose 4,6-dehydratase n=1 Tax=Rhizobium sp. SAFR-030 TaxID=3387277 RepID=UPI003F80F066